MFSVVWVNAVWAQNNTLEEEEALEGQLVPLPTNNTLVKDLLNLAVRAFGEFESTEADIRIEEILSAQMQFLDGENYQIRARITMYNSPFLCEFGVFREPRGDSRSVNLGQCRPKIVPSLSQILGLS